MPCDEEISVAFATTEEERLEAYKLRHLVFRDELGRSSFYSDSESCTYADDIDHEGGQLIVAKLASGEVIGTLRLALRRHRRFLPEDEYGFAELIASKRNPGSLALADRGAIRKDYRGRRLYPLLWDALEDRCQREQVELLLGVIDARNPPLNKFHTARGWKIYKADCQEEDGTWNYISKRMGLETSQ